MKFRTKFFIIFLLFLAGVFVVYHFFKQSSTFSFDFSAEQNKNDAELEKIVKADLDGKVGTFAVYIEELPATDSAKLSSGEVLPLRKYVLNEKKFFPSASLYKLILLAATFKRIESGELKMENEISGTKSHLTDILGSVDFGYEDMPENFEFTVEEILERIGRISDNFAAIMLTEKLRQLSVLGSQLSESGQSVISPSVTEKQKTGGLNSENRNLKTDNQTDPLLQMAKELGMNNTSFEGIPNTTASDIALFFRKLYQGEVVSKSASEKIIEILSLSGIIDRIPAKLGKDVIVVHKTGELSHLRHDAGLVSPPNYSNSPNHPYLIVLLSKDLEFEDEGVETLANISKDVWDYFSK